MTNDNFKNWEHVNRTIKIKAKVIPVSEYRRMKKPVSKRSHRESALQQACVKWFDSTYPKLKLNLFSIPNEGARTPKNGARMKAQGRRAGVADMFLAKKGNSGTFDGSGSIMVKSPDSFGLFVELKTDNGKMSEPQNKFAVAIRSCGYQYEVVRNSDDFKKLIEGYLA